MNKYDLVHKKRDEMRNRRLERINRRTFPPNRYQIDLQDMVQPELVIDIEENEPLMIAHLPITDEMIVEKYNFIGRDTNRSSSYNRSSSNCISR